MRLPSMWKMACVGGLSTLRDIEAFMNQMADDLLNFILDQIARRHSSGCFALLFLAWPTFSQTERCGQQDLKASLPPKAEAYSDAMALRELLSKHGIAVQCVLQSKMDGTFEGQMGAALYRTDRGDFEVLFLPQPNTFQLLKVVERQDGERYTYSFNGPPKPWPANRIDSAQRIYFIKHKNMLFVLSNKQLAATLENFVRSAVNLAGGSELA